MTPNPTPYNIDPMATAKRISLDEARVMRARDEWDAMTPFERIMEFERRQKEPLPALKGLGKNPITGEMIYTNQPAETMLERDERIAKFLKSNKKYADILSGKVQPSKKIQEDSSVKINEEEKITPSSEELPAPELNIPAPNILSELRYFKSPNLKSRTPPPIFEKTFLSESNEPPAPLSKSLSPEAQAVIATVEAAKAAAPAAGKAILKAAEVLPVIGGSISRARLAAATPEISKFVSGPVFEAAKEVESRGLKAAPGIAEKMSPIAIRAALSSVKPALKGAEKIGSIAREVAQYGDLEKQIKERARRRTLLGESYQFALEDEQRRAAKTIAQKTKSNKLVSSGSR